MKDLSAFVSGLYEAFILRDLMSYVLPGAIVLLSVLLLWRDAGQIKVFFIDLHWWFLVPLLALTFVVGFALHCFGELVGLIKLSLIGKCPKWGERFAIFCCCQSKHNIAWLEEVYEQWIEYLHKTDETSWGTTHLERLVSMKIMCGNVFLAACLAAVAIPVGVLGDTGSWTSYLLTFSYAVLLTVSLFWGHRMYVLRQDSWVRIGAK